ncbi:MAG: protein-tyrosine-phosphatase [Crocinitomicaceae bacterium]|nr:protein-tyrosine-phosphatase [Crocinitomicaceae bacterium]
MNTTLQKFISGCTKDFGSIPKERKTVLEKLAAFVRERKNNPQINLIFICVHNSRRSHLSQTWAQIAANYYKLNNVYCYSGGTEVTALYPAAAEALEQQGVTVKKIAEGNNPIYTLKYDANARPIIGFSKLYDSPYNPQSGFAAVMVCSSADTNCPYISTCDERFLISFEDPKEFDGTPQQMEKYLERSKQIATELLYAFSKVEQ